MRVIELNMLAAVIGRRSWKSSNTEVISFNCPKKGVRVTEIFLHGYLIATVSPGSDWTHKVLTLHWGTPWHFSRTTFSRMNALLLRLTGPGNGCYTHKHQPYLQRFGKDRPMELEAGDSYSFTAYC